MTKLEKQERIITLQDELRGIISNGEAEVRELNETENSRMAEIRSEIDTLNNEIETEEKEERKIAENNNTIKKETKNMSKFSLFNTVKAVAEGNVSDEMRAFVNGNKIEMRSVIQAQGDPTTGIENVPTDKARLDVAVRNASVLNKLDCTWFGNAVGDIALPKYSGSECGWKSELGTADYGEGEFSEVVLKPHRLTSVIRISKTFLEQSPEDAEAILMADLSNSIAEKLDKTIFGSLSGTTDRPAGLFADSGYTTTGGTISAITYQDFLDLELKVEEHNGTNFTFIASPSIKYAAKNCQMASGLQMVWDNNEVDGYKAVISNSVEKGGIIAMDPRDLAVAFWNGMGDIVVDNYTLAQDNQIRLVINMYVDAKLRGDRIAAAIFE